MPFLETLIGVYGFLSLSHLFIQINLSHADYLRSRKREHDASFTPRVAIIVPTYNEETKALRDCVASCQAQVYAGDYAVVVVNDGSKDPTGFHEVQAEFETDKKKLHSTRYRSKKSTLRGVFFLDILQNRGKRHAQKSGFDFVHGWADVFVTVDSDTILDPHAVANLVQRFKNPEIGAVTGDVQVIKTEKFLSHLIAGRYWMAFHQERSAQSLFGNVLCCSGPLAAYRADIIDKVKADYTSQRFLGQLCTYGDDRHLTNLVLREGYRVKFERRAKARTHVPQTIPMYLKQQTRWNKSFYRELIWTLKIIFKDKRRLSLYTLYDLAIQIFLPPLLMLSLLFVVYKSITVSWMYGLTYLAVMVGISLVRSLYGFYRTTDQTLLKFPAYAFMYIFLLIPVRIYALTTLTTTHWGTR